MLIMKVECSSETVGELNQLSNLHLVDPNGSILLIPVEVPQPPRLPSSPSSGSLLLCHSFLLTWSAFTSASFVSKPAPQPRPESRPAQVAAPDPATAAVVRLALWHGSKTHRIAPGP